MKMILVCVRVGFASGHDSTAATHAVGWVSESEAPQGDAS
jgi:hypothetical protein